jgi:hypothetical protein
VEFAKHMQAVQKLSDQIQTVLLEEPSLLVGMQGQSTIFQVVVLHLLALHRLGKDGAWKVLETAAYYAAGASQRGRS